MKIVIIGNSAHFNALLTHRFTPKNTVRSGKRLWEVEVAVGSGDIEAAPVWMIEAVQADGIIYALVPENDPTWIVNSPPSIFLSTLNSLLFPSRPAILVTSHRSLIDSTLPVVKRRLEIDPETGENCGEALLSIVHWITIIT